MNTIVKKIKKVNGRYTGLLIILLCVLFILITRLLYLHVIHKDFLRSQGASRTTKIVKTKVPRGMITDRNGIPLAVSTLVESVWVNPREFNIKHPKIKALSKLLQIDIKSLKAKINKYAHKEFIYLKRHVSPDLAKKVGDLKLPGIHLMSEYRRYYPAGEVTAHVLGFTNIDDVGQEGLELAFDNWLRGIIGKARFVKDRLGRSVEYLENLSTGQIGHDLAISIDQRLQYLAYRALHNAVVENKAESGSAVVLDVNTGEILAMVNSPTFNPNQRTRNNSKKIYRNLAVTDHYEPGSVFKTFSMVSILENIKISIDDTIDTNPGYLYLPGGVIREIDNKNYGLIKVSNILKHSSNIGITKLALNLPAESLWQTYDKLGFGITTDSGFPGESSGFLSLPRKNQSFVLATMSFGYGLAATPLQLARAYAILGAGGIKRPVSFIKIDQAPLGVRVIDSNIAQQIVLMLSEAVEHKHSNARVAGYRVAGKTGTARLLGKNGYERSRHRAIFAGLAPAINPRFAIVVAIHNIQSNRYYGNQVAAPVFSDIATGALRLFNVAPDLLETQGVYLAQKNGKGHS